MDIKVVDDADRIRQWSLDTLTHMALAMPVAETPCPHCGVQIRYPLVARKTDLDMFEQMVSVAHRVMNDYGITGNLLAEIRAKCLVEVTRRKDLST